MVRGIFVFFTQFLFQLFFFFFVNIHCKLLPLRLSQLVRKKKTFQTTMGREKCTLYHAYYGNMGGQLSKRGIQNQIDFCPKLWPIIVNYCLYFVNRRSAKDSCNCQKMKKSDFPIQISMSEMIRIFLFLFSLNNIVISFLTTQHKLQ